MDMNKPRDQIWFRIMHSERLARLYAYRSAKIRQVYNILSVGILAASSGAAVSLLVQLPYKDWIAAGLFFVVAVISIWMVQFDYAGQATVARILGNQCREIATEWTRLWAKQDDENIATLIELLENRMHSITAENLPHNKKIDELNVQCAREAKSVLAMQFGR